MKYGLVDGRRQEAEPNLSGNCPNCGSSLIAKCGEIRIWHWAHQGNRTCDKWGEPETVWHRNWKNEFPDKWQEVVHHAEDGERHIADVKTESGCAVEFQHSYLRPEERRAREDFYPEMIWVVNGLRRERDAPRFYQALKCSRVVEWKPLTLSFPAGEGALLRDWGESTVPVFFDFGLTDMHKDIFHIGAPALWRLNPESPDGCAHLAPVRRASFIQSLSGGEPIKGIDRSNILEFVRTKRIAQKFAMQRLRLAAKRLSCRRARF